MSFIKFLMEQKLDAEIAAEQLAESEDRMVVVPGIGQMRYSQLEARARGMLESIMEDISADDPDRWVRVQAKLSDSALATYIRTLAQLNQQ